MKMVFQVSGASKAPMFENLNFSLTNSESLVLMGPSGVGKSTILKCLAGLISFDQGELWLDNKLRMLPSQKAISFDFLYDGFVYFFKQVDRIEF
jgi:ABC-type sugar transport system ATPase subunit